MIRIGVLASGSGTNLAALHQACQDGRIDGAIALVLSNVAGAPVLERAASAGLATACLPSRGMADRAAYDAALVERLQAAGIDLVCLAGYMRLVTPEFLRAFGPGPSSRGCPRVLNVHPALLPAFPGLKAQAQALAAGVRLAGCTVHFVDEGTDTGPVVAQAAVPVLDDDTEASLSARILVEEHRLYPQAVAWFAAGRLSLSGRRVHLDPAPASAPAAPGRVAFPPVEG